ncbi:hypothetical protein NBRC110019_29030 [Neptunitalea chrysea]|uniref:DUF4920 domain-containing protein n=1 Tax=Neptunitalea chrysea TaxID=1647581 RepID=A0A9W6B8V6_9FLAO|nr:DUF4920 domain-containing protein [Neptunitalea chrysea]GLB53862.1 hypothetical protein NBRC110019_29030 [Neptunitalea chrysea]
MKKLFVMCATLFVLASCKKEKEVVYKSFGDEIVSSGAISTSELTEDYKHLKAGDTIDVKFEGTIESVCQKKGCWMKVGLEQGEETFIRFKDYGFFVPMNASNKQTVVSGKAFVTETSVDELKHYAKDAGKSDAEITAITEPKREYAFLASGVLIEEPKQE